MVPIVKLENISIDIKTLTENSSQLTTFLLMCSAPNLYPLSAERMRKDDYFVGYRRAAERIRRHYQHRRH